MSKSLSRLHALAGERSVVSSTHNFLRGGLNLAPGAAPGSFAGYQRFLPQYCKPCNTNDLITDRVGFEPTVRFHVHTLSRRAP